MKFERTQDSFYSHTETFGLGNYQGNAFTTGCSPNAQEYPKCHAKTEIFDMSEMVWYSDMRPSVTFQSPSDYPFIGDDSSEKGIYHYSTANTADAVYIIGGHVTGHIVAEFRDYQWKHVADLKQGRSRHGSIAFGDQTIIIGGHSDVRGDLSTELWDFQTQNGRTIEPTLPVYGGYSNGIGLYFVDANFGSSCNSDSDNLGDSFFGPWG